MLLTEEEATSRWCPFARVALGGRLPTSMNRVQEIGRVNDDATVTRGAVTLPGGAYCIASKCMAWAPRGLCSQSGERLAKAGGTE